MKTGCRESVCAEKAHATLDKRSEKASLWRSPELRPEGDTGIGWEENAGHVPRSRAEKCVAKVCDVEE